MKFLITGGAGFIGSALIRYIISETEHDVLNLDSLTYAGNLESLDHVSASSRYKFVKSNICDREALEKIFADYQPDILMHLAAESHVDRSIDGSDIFIETNIIGTYRLLEVALSYWRGLPHENRNIFRFHHVSTDEVYGDLEKGADRFTEFTSYAPSSPYSATKGSSDHLVRSWNRTFGLPTVITNCSNNYGPYQFPEKLIPHMIISALNEREMPIYGDGRQVRDWLHVEDHVRALVLVATTAESGETYNIGGDNEKENIEVVGDICDALEKSVHRRLKNINSYRELITFVRDRPGHDLRYAVDASKIKNDLGWLPRETFETGLEKTVNWYLKNSHWWERIISGEYRLSRAG